MSRRRRPAQGRPARGRPEAEPRAGRPHQPRWGLGRSVGVALGVFVVVTLIAWAAGAANLGVAAGIGQVAFGVTVVALMIWR